MASKPTVTLTFAGDEKKLTDAMERVGQSSKSMADDVGRSSREMQRTGADFDALAEKSDNVDTRAMGFRDTVTGVSDSLKGLTDSSLSTEERLLTLGMGVGDLASGFTNLLIPAMGNLAGFMRGGLASAMSFIAAHPLLLTIGLLAAAVIFLISQTEWFQNVATRVFNWVGNLAKNVFGGALNWVINTWNGLIGWFERLPGAVGRALSGLGGAIANAFKFALNVGIDALNWGIDRLNGLIHGVNVINPFGDIPSIPKIARLHTGGRVPGMPGEEVLTVLQGGERVSTSGQGGGTTINFGGNVDSAFASAFMKLVRSGDIQLSTT